MNIIELPKAEFDIVQDDKDWTILLDKVVNKTYMYSKAEKRWVFPTGSRVEMIAKLSGVDLGS